MPIFRFRKTHLKAALCGVAVVLSLTATTAFAAPSPGAEAGAAENQLLPVRGVVRASAEAVLSSEFAAQIETLGFREGETFRRGDLLVAFDCRRLEAQLASAKAQQTEAAALLRSVEYLQQRNAASRQEVETASARMARSRADVEAIGIQVEHCRILAPFDGRVAELAVHEHETPGAGKPLLSIVSERDPSIELIVPSAWLAWLKPGARFRFKVDETGTEYVSEITRLGGAIDTVSQTIKVFARFNDATTNILPGMSGTAEFLSTTRGARHD